MKKKLLEPVIICAVALLAALFAEFVLFRIPANSLRAHTGETRTVSPDDTYAYQSADLDDGVITFTGDSTSTVSIGSVSELRTLRLCAVGPNRRGRLTVQLTAADSNGGSVERKISFDFSPADGNSMFFDLGSDYDAESVLLIFEKCKDMVISSVVLNAEPEHEFFFLRMLGVWCLVAFALFCVRCRLFTLFYEHSNRFHNLALAGSVFASVLLIAFISLFGGPYTVEYPVSEEDELYAYGNYVQQTDAFIKKQLYLDLTPPDSLFDCENPYDPADRAAHGVSTEDIWDKAFYEGRLYSYFGVLPVLLVYMPVWLITGRMATDTLACTVFALIAAVFTALSLRELVLRYSVRARLLTLCAAVPATLAASMVFTMQASANFYTVPVICGMAFLTVFIYFSLRGARAQMLQARCALFAAAGLSLACIVASRPQHALYGVVLLPVFFGVLCEKKSVKDKSLMAISFAVPLLAGLFAIGLYNAARFSGPLDFGSTYQITVSDTAKNTLRPQLFSYAMFHYFLQPLELSRFPLAGLTRVRLESYGVDYIYIGESFGALMMPLNWGIFTSVYYALKNRPRRLLVIVGAISVVAVAFIDFCLAGAHIRYTCDIMTVIALISALGLIEIDSKSGLKCVTAVVHVLMALSLIYAFSLALDNEVDLIMHNNPALLYAIRRALFI